MQEECDELSADSILPQLAAAEAGVRRALETRQAPIHSILGDLILVQMEFSALKGEEAIERRLARTRTELLSSLPDFQAAKKFGEKRESIVYKTGRKGLGYYAMTA